MRESEQWIGRKVLRLRYGLAVLVGVCCYALGPVSSHGYSNQDRSMVCGGADRMGGESDNVRQVRLLRGPPPAALSQILRVLREPEPEVAKLPGPLARLGFNEVWIDAIRHIATSGGLGWRVFLVPGVSRDGACLPRARRARANPGEPLISLDIYEPSGQVGARAYSVDDVVAGRAVLVFPLFAARNHELVLGLVPDNVSRVEIKAGDMPAQMAQVKDNFFEVEARVPMRQGTSNAVTSVTTSITWYDASGKSLKTISRGDRRVSLNATVEIPET
jgi:hypothetical protein